MNLDITYRGPLASCDYACAYCPFAKKHDNKEARDRDEQALSRFVDWVGSRKGKDTLRILITPWGEALVRKWYRTAITALSNMEHVDKVVIQTNISTPLQWLEQVDKGSVALWTTFHSTETTIERFVKQTSYLDKIGVAHSVGIVGMNANQQAAKSLRNQLNPDTYLWVNAYKDDPLHYTKEDIEFFQEIDPHFSINNQYHPSLNMACNSGVTSISLNGEGDVKPCHFVGEVMGNIYTQELHDVLLENYLCPADKCGCYIGYIHLKGLHLESVYGERILERISG